MDGVSKLVLSIVVEQKQKLRDQTSRRLAFLEGLVEEEMGFGQDGFESAKVERGLSFFAEFEKCLSMLGGFEELASVEAPAVDGHDGRAIQDADLGVGSGEGEVFTDGVWRNGILIEIETDEDSFGGESRLEQTRPRIGSGAAPEGGSVPRERHRGPFEGFSRDEAGEAFGHTTGGLSD